MILKKLRHLRIFPFMEDHIRSVAEGIHDLNARRKGRVCLLFAQHEKHDGKDMLPSCFYSAVPYIFKIKLLSRQKNVEEQRVNRNWNLASDNRLSSKKHFYNYMQN